MDAIQPTLKIGGLEELPRSNATDANAEGFIEALRDAIDSVDDLQKSSEAAQSAYVRGEPVELHDVLIQVEQAELAFKTMMEVRNKLIDAYREVMRIAG